MLFEARADAWESAKKQRETGADETRYATKDDYSNWV